jgi:mRNA-degrading endonuclease RelE of RelBE toxin-antitoxin system
VYSSEFTDEALADIRKLPKHIRNSLRREFKNKLHIDPVSCSEPLEGLLEGFRSFHHGDYRVVYRVFEDIGVFAVVGIGKKDKGHHAEIYKQLENLAASGKLASAVLEACRSIISDGPKSES